MFPTQSNCGFVPGRQNPYVYSNNMLCSYAQGYFGAYPNALMGWDTSARGFEASPWAWQWSERIMPQQVRAVFQLPPTRCTERASL